MTGYVGIIEYGMGNIQSVMNALEFLSVKTKVINEPSELSLVDKIILPGVGAFGEAMVKLNDSGFIDCLNREVIERKKLFLGICLGMQLVCKDSFEFGHFKGLGWIDSSVRRFDSSNGLRVPHVGWNNLKIRRQNTLIEQSGNDGPDVYFVHSYFVDSLDPGYVIASCDYGIEFAAAIEKDNVFAVQFHPEKSQSSGLKILKAFLER